MGRGGGGGVEILFKSLHCYKLQPDKPVPDQTPIDLPLSRVIISAVIAYSPVADLEKVPWNLLTDRLLYHFVFRLGFFATEENCMQLTFGLVLGTCASFFCAAA